MSKFSMNPKNWFSKEHGPREMKSATIPVSQDSFLAYAFGAPGGWVSDSQAKGFYRQTSAIATAVDMIADAIKQITPVIKEGDKFIKDDPALDLLKKPNGFSDWMLFMGTIARNYLLKHDSLMLAPGNVRRPPLELWPLALQNTSIVQAEDDYPANYIVSTGVMKGNYIRVENNRLRSARFYDGNVKELYHIRGYSSRRNHLESDSPLQAAALEVRQIIQGKYHNVKLLENGGRLSLLVTFNDEEEITDDEHKRRVRRLNEQFAGPKSAGRIGVISGADVQNIKEFGKSNKDMDFANLETLAGNAIYLRYQIPLALVTMEASTFDNLKTGIELLYDNAVLPNANVLFSGLSQFILPRFGKDPNKTQITFDPESIEPLKNRKLDEIAKRKKTGIETPNELRSLMQNREDVEHGDVIYQMKSMVPLGTEEEKPKPEKDDNAEEPTV